MVVEFVILSGFLIISAYTTITLWRDHCAVNRVSVST